MSSLWTAFVHPISRATRRRRAKEIVGLFPRFNQSKVLDLGGSRHFWEKMEGILEPADLTVLNIADDGQAMGISEASLPNMKIELYDGSTIPYPDGFFDIVICNSVIEHVPPSQRKRVMEEIKRVGKSFIVQTPSLSFPIEPHFVMPFVHWLPRPIGKKLVRFGLYAVLTRFPQEKLDSYFEEVNLLSKKELVDYAPNAKLLTERFLLMPKSYTLVSLDQRAA